MYILLRKEPFKMYINLCDTPQGPHHENQNQENERGKFVFAALQERELIDKDAEVLQKDIY